MPSLVAVTSLPGGLVAGPYEFSWAHGLASATPLLELFARTASGWRQLGPGEFSAGTSAGVAVLSLASTPPPAPAVGYVKAVATNLEALTSPTATSPAGSGAGWAAGRSRLISRGLAIAARLHPATITFAGASPITATRRFSAEGRVARAGGLTASVPAAYFIARADLPEGVVLEPHTTRFLDGETPYLLHTLDAEPSEPHVRLTADLANR